MTSPYEPAQVGREVQIEGAGPDVLAVRTEILFIDAGVTNYQSWLDGVRDGVEVVVLEAGRDGLAQIAESLAGRSGVDAVHVISHGGPGGLTLGASSITLDDLAAHSAELSAIRQALSPDAELLLYGCNVAEGQVGAAFIAALAEAVDADVAASVDPTGAMRLGGDWDLEASTGPTQTGIALSAEGMEQFAGLLATPADQNFDAQPTGLTGLATASFGDFTFTANNGADLAIIDHTADSSDTPITAASGDKALRFNGSLTNTGITQFTIGSTSGDEFKLDNLQVFFVFAGEEMLVEGLVDGQVVYSQNIFSTAGTYGSIQYTEEPSFLGSLIFTGWDWIDQVRFSTAGTTTSIDFEVDDINVSAGVAPDTAPSITGTASAPSINDTATTTPFANLSFADADGDGGTIAIAYTAANGTLAGTGLSGSAGSYTLTGASPAELSARLQALVFTPTENQTAPGGTVQTTFTLTPNDGATNGTAHNTTEVTATSVNDTPSATNLTQTIGYAEDPGGAVALGDIVVSDVDASETITATLTLSNAAAGTLSVGTFGSATSTYTAGTGVWTVSGSVADVNAALAAAAFTPAVNWDQDVTIATQIRDAAGAGPANGVITLDVTPANDAPAVTTSVGSAAYTENAVATLVDSGLTLSDVDSASLSSASVSITGNYQSGADVLGFTNDGSTMGNVVGSFDPGAGVLTLTSAGGTASVAQWQAALRAVTFANTSEAPSSSTRTISFSVSDGEAAGAGSRSVSVTAANDAPTTNAAHGYLNTGASTETGGLVTINNLMLHEGDPDDSGTGVTYTVGAAPTAGTLFIDLNGNGVVDGGESLGAGSTFTQDDIDLGRIKYRHGGGGQTSDSLGFSVADGGEDGAAALTGQTFAFTIADRPVVSIGAGSPSHAEDGAATVVAANLTLADSDSPNLAGATVTITDLVGGDVLGFADQNGITGSYNAGTGVLTLTGTASLAQYEAALRSVTYSTTSDNPATAVGSGDRYIEFRVNDGALTSAAGTNAAVSVSNTNDAPVLDASASPALAGIAEDAAAPVNGSTVGSTLVSNLLGAASDVDSGALQGIAVVGASAQGTLWYSTDGGATWTQAPAVSEGSALLLQADARLYFQPDANFAGTMADAVTVRAWDRTSGANGGSADTTTNGGASAFSTATDTVAITISAVNDAPTIIPGPYAPTSTDEDTTSDPISVSTLLSGLDLADADPGASGGVALVGASGNGVWQYSTDGANWFAVGAISGNSALLLNSGAQIRYVPDGVGGEGPSLTLRAWDQTSGTATSGGTRSTADTTVNGGSTAFSATVGDLRVPVAAVNDAPTLTGGAIHVLAGTDEDTSTGGTLVSDLLATASRGDVDAGALSGVAITGVVGSGGWEYSTDGATWTAFGAVSPEAALLLSATTQVRYAPDQADGETATLSFRAWDQTSGAASANGAPQTADTTTFGGTSAFSSQTAGASLTVSAVNDVPTGSVTISGTPQVGATLTASHTLADPDGLDPANITYQWQADGVDIGGATAASLVVTQAVVGQVITVTINYVDGGGTAESVASAATAAVSNPPPPPPTNTPTPGDDVLTIADAGGSVSAGAGADSVTGGAADDFVQGNAGMDTLYGGDGVDIVHGGKDNDLVQGNAGADRVFGDLGDDVVHGGQGDDLVQGNAGDDHVSGDRGDDVVRGGQGHDQVFGGEGSDHLFGDLGNDTLTGGAGADAFRFPEGAQGQDVITDFSRAEGDTIWISSSLASDFAELVGRMSEGPDGDAVIDLGDQVITIQGIAPNALSAGDFVFG